jgi:hypothetical protein
VEIVITALLNSSKHDVAIRALGLIQGVAELVKKTPNSSKLTQHQE